MNVPDLQVELSSIKFLEMRKILLALAFTLSLLKGWGQEQEIRSVIDRMFQSMYSADTGVLRTCFMPGARLLTYAINKEGKDVVREETLNEILTGVAQIKNAELE